MIMKKYFTLIMLLLVNTGLNSMNLFVSSDPQKVPMDIKKDVTEKQGNEYERSNFISIVEVYYDSETKNVKCELYNIGTANIYIVDTNGVIINEMSTDTYIPVAIELSSACCCDCDFFVILQSDYIYAEGVVEQ